MKEQQVSYFDLLTIRYPFTAIVSFLHRLSGVIIFLFIPFLLWLLITALGSEAGFRHTQSILNYPILKFLLWILWVGIGYHFLAGIRHLLMDFGIGESLTSARVSGALAIIFTLLWSILTGIWLW